MEIGRISVMVEVDGQICVVLLPEERKKLLVQMAASLSDNGKLNVAKCPNDFRFETLAGRLSGREVPTDVPDDVMAPACVD
jgi:hypothetical protein